MERLRILCLLVVCAFAGCRENSSVAALDGELLVNPPSLDFGRTWVGHRAAKTLELQNTGRRALDVTLELGAPFDAPASVRVSGGERLEVELGVTAPASGAVSGALLVSANGSTQEVALRADAFAPLDCPSRDCHPSTFNPLTGQCAETVADDGASCGGHQCIAAGVCAAGVCVGQARDCDDHDACTTDACEATMGCVHAAVTCPGSPRSCEVGVCLPTTGCGLAPANEGALCGDNDCVTAHVCITGQCQSRPAPDGSECKAATSCRAPGVCHQQTCELPQPTPLHPAWRYEADAGVTLNFLGHVDDQGNLYATETGPFLRNAMAGAESVAGVPFVDRNTIPTPTFLVSLSPTGAVRFRVQVATDCASCSSGLWFSIDSPNHRLFFNVKGTTQARSTDTGQLAWQTVPTAGLPAYDLRPDGGASFYASSPLLVGADGVGVPVIEGNGDHHSYVQVFDRATGAFRWQFHRKGHLYGSGVAPGGELWTSSANCWAVAGEMARVDGLGQPQAVKFVQWIPAIYGAGMAIGTANGKLQLLDAALNLTDLSTMTGAGPSAQPLLSGQQLVLWDNPSRSLHSVNLATGAHAFTFPGVSGSAPDFELLRDGGVAWTARIPDAGLLGAVDGRGEEIVQCPLSTPVESPTAIIHGRASMQSNGGIVSYDVPGLDVEPSGWVTRHGSLQRGFRAR